MSQLERNLQSKNVQTNLQLKSGIVPWRLLDPEGKSVKTTVKQRSYTESLLLQLLILSQEIAAKDLYSIANVNQEKERKKPIGNGEVAVTMWYLENRCGLVLSFFLQCNTCMQNIVIWIWFFFQVSRQFLDSGETGSNPRSLANLHNNQAGRVAVRKTMRQLCKCHGVSGSCATQTCWRQISDFKEVGTFLKKQYKRALRYLSLLFTICSHELNKHFSGLITMTVHWTD